MTETATAKARHARATATKRKLVMGLRVVFNLDQHRAEMCWRDARGELELADLASVVDRTAMRVRKAREDRAHGRV